jgi:type I restriction-modification system DNA methylase subunit
VSPFFHNFDQKSHFPEAILNETLGIPNNKCFAQHIKRSIDLVNKKIKNQQNFEWLYIYVSHHMHERMKNDYQFKNKIVYGPGEKHQ